MSEEKEITYLGDVQRLCLNPGDIVVLSVDHVISDKTADWMREYINNAIPDHKVLVLSANVKIGVMGKA